MAFLSIERVSKYFPQLEGATGRTARQESFCVFRDVDLRLDRGEFVTLIGHSGCGAWLGPHGRISKLRPDALVIGL
jgi:ABC-type oligopeptide transport system ATPase subunit